MGACDVDIPSFVPHLACIAIDALVVVEGLACVVDEGINARMLGLEGLKCGGDGFVVLKVDLDGFERVGGRFVRGETLQG